MINREILGKVLALVESKGLSDDTISLLRSSFPGCHFTYCMDDDVVYSQAYIERDDFNVYLVDSREHCSKLTQDADIASGVVLAEIVA